MFALEAALKPANPRVMALSTDVSRPRYALRASSSELTPPPHAAMAEKTLKAARATIGAERIAPKCTGPLPVLSRIGKGPHPVVDLGKCVTATAHVLHTRTWVRAPRTQGDARRSAQARASVQAQYRMRSESRAGSIAG